MITSIVFTFCISFSNVILHMVLGMVVVSLWPFFRIAAWVAKCVHCRLGIQAVDRHRSVNINCHHDKMARTKTNTQNNTKHIEHQDATDI